MALFSRKDRKADIDKYITEAIEKAAQSLMGTPMYNQAGYANVIPAQPVGGQGLAQQSGWEAQALPRPGDAFGSMLGPAAPLLPSPIDPVNPNTGRAEPRKFQFQVAYNLNLTQQDVPWSVLRALADQCDIIARAITIRVSEVVKMNWSFTLSDLAIKEIMAEQNVSNAQAAKIGRDKYKNQISELTEFWENPYPQADRGWSEWITEFSWQHLVYDGVPVFPQYNLGGKVIGFNIIDAPTIKILLDNRGDIPRPPAPAFQQILWGFPRGEFTASPDSDVDGEYYANAEGTSFKTDTMAYFIRNRRTWSPYGFSAVEQAIPAATLYLERQRWFIDDFQAGTMPMTFMKTDSQEIDHLRLAAFERVFNDKMVGSSEERHKIKVLPKGFDPVIAPEMTERYKPDMDEYIIKKIASIFGIAPGQLGVVARAGLGGGKGAADGEAQSAETVSARPMENFIVEVINSLCRRFLGMDKNVTFNLQDRSTAENEAEKAKAYQTALSSGTMTLNDARGDMGLPLYDMQEADEPFLLTATGPVFLKGTLETQQQQAQAQAQGATNDQAKPGEDSQAPQGEESSQGTPPTNNGKGKNQKTGVDEQKSAEAKAYKVFSRTPRGREFEFEFHTPEEIAILKAQVAEPKAQITDTPKERSATKGHNPDLTKGRTQDVGGYKERQEVIKKFRVYIQSGLNNLVSGVHTTVEQALKATATDPETVRSASYLAVAQNIKMDTTKLNAALEALHEAAVAAGLDVAAKEVSLPAIQGGKAVTDLLNERSITLKQLTQTTLDRINTAVANGVANGHDYKTISQSIYAAINGQSPSTEPTPAMAPGSFGTDVAVQTRADIIAMTETNRAYNAATIDTYSAAGASGWNWILDGDPCERCQQKAEENPHPIDDDTPPEHPNCQCGMEAVWDNSQPGDAVTQDVTQTAE